MDPKRIGEIAYLALRCESKAHGLTLKPDFRRELGNLAIAIDVPLQEIVELHEFLCRATLEVMFGKKLPEGHRPPTLSDERLHDIALRVFKHKLRKNGIRLRPGFKREQKKLAEEIGVPFVELLEAHRLVHLEVFNLLYSDPSNDEEETKSSAQQHQG